LKHKNARLFAKHISRVLLATWVNSVLGALHTRHNNCFNLSCLFLFVSGFVNGQPDADLRAEKPEDRKALLFSFFLLPVVSPFLPNTSGTRDRVFHSRRFLFDLGSSARST
jgi:hypothetical protein